MPRDTKRYDFVYNKKTGLEMAIPKNKGDCLFSTDGKDGARFNPAEQELMKGRPLTRALHDIKVVFDGVIVGVEDIKIDRVKELYRGE